MASFPFPFFFFFLLPVDYEMTVESQGACSIQAGRSARLSLQTEEGLSPVSTACTGFPSRAFFFFLTVEQEQLAHRADSSLSSEDSGWGVGTSLCGLIPSC